MRIVFTNRKLKDRYSRDFLERKKNKSIVSFKKYIKSQKIYLPSSGIIFFSYSSSKKNVNYLLMELHTSKDLEKYSPGFTKADIIKGLIDLDFNCHIISPHSDGHHNLIATDRTTQQSYLNNTSKLKYLKIEKDLTASVLYDRNFSDIFILAIKKEINITSLDCF